MSEPTQLDQNLAALHEEIVNLRGELDSVARLEREATLQEVFEVLAPTIVSMVHRQANVPDASVERVVGTLELSLLELGLSRWARPGEVLELWPDEAVRDFELDRPVSSDATMVRVEILASGWTRGNKIIARPVGRVLEVVHAPE